MGGEAEVASGIAALRDARPEDYRADDGEARRRFEARLQALKELEGDSLLVPEPRALGGFGYEIAGGLYNIDTLTFFEALVALERGAVLDEIRAPGRRVVLDVGGRWGGFAYQLKTLFPNVTYVILDRPELLSVSATYLTTLFPEATIHFDGESDAPADWESVDFAFVPAHRSDALHGVQPDLTVSVTSDGHARLAWELGCPFVYSFDPQGGVREALGRYYWTYEVPVLELAARPLRERLLSIVDPDSSSTHRHVVGWRRAST